MSSQNSEPLPGPSEEITNENVLKIDPGVCVESVICPTNSFSDFTKDMHLSLEEEDFKLAQGNSTIRVIKSEIETPGKNGEVKSSVSIDNLNKEEINSPTPVCTENVTNDTVEDYLNSAELVDKQKHIFILSSAGKPIYSRYGNEDKLAGLCGVIQALTSVVEEKKKDVLRSIHTPTCKAVFFVKGPLILVAVSKTNESEAQLNLQLTYAFNEIVSVLTLTHINKIFEQRTNYDLRRLLSGAERFIDHLIYFMEDDPAFLLGAVRCLPLASNVRDTITNAIVSSCNKIKDLVFAVLLAEGQLITIVRMKKYRMHWSDLHLLFNLIRSTESFKNAESWTPICLPKFDATGYLHAHVSYLSDDCQACLLLLTVHKDSFFALSKAKNDITEKLRKNNVLSHINDAIERKCDFSTTNCLRHIGVAEIRHFLYKCKSTSQLYVSDVVRSNNPKHSEEQSRISKINDINYIERYRSVADMVHNTCRPAKLVFISNSRETILAWVTVNFELYITFDSLIEKNEAIISVDKLLRWIKKEEENVFIMNAPTF